MARQTDMRLIKPSYEIQIREMMLPLLVEMKRRIPVIFDDIGS